MLENDVFDFESATLHTLDDILRRAFRARHHMNFRFQPDTGHSDRLANALLVIDDKLLRQDVQDFLIGRYRHRACRIDHSVDIAGTDFLVADGDDAV